MADLLDASGSAATGGSSQHSQDHHDVQLVNVLTKAWTQTWAQICQWNDPAASVLLLNLARGAAESAREKLSSPRRPARKAAPLAAVTMAQGSYYSYAARHTQEARHKHDLQAWQLIAAGAVARAVAQVASYPLDTLKTRLQVTASNSQLVAWQQALAASSRSVQLGPLQLKVVNAVQAGGISSLYRGVAGAAVACLPAALLFFATDAACKHLLARHKAAQRHSTRSAAEGPSMLHHMLSSCSAALVSAFVRVPGDVCKHRVQAFVYPSLAEAAHSIWRSKGPAGLFCGFTATLVRDVPEMAIQFTLYEALRKAHATASQDGAPAGGLGTLLMGGLAGAAASALTTPLDVIKSQMQCQGQTSAVGALHNVLLQRGLPGLMSGVGPRVAQSALTMAVFFTLYEAFKSRILQQQPLAGRSSAARPHQQRQQWRAAPLMPALVVRLRDAAPQYAPAQSHHLLDMAVPLQHHA